MDLHQTGPVGEGSDHLQLIKLWPSCTSGKGVCSGAKIFGSAPPYYSQRAVFASLRALFHVFIEKRGCRGVSQSRLSWAAYSSWGTHPHTLCNRLINVFVATIRGGLCWTFAACPYTSATRSLTCTQCSFREITIICSYDKAPAYRANPSSRPN